MAYLIARPVVDLAPAATRVFPIPFFVPMFCVFLRVPLSQVFVGDPRSSEFVDHARYGRGAHFAFVR